MRKSDLTRIKKSKLALDKKLKENNITLVSDFIDTQTKIKVRCNVCNKEWEVRPNGFSGECKFCNRVKSTKSSFSKLHPDFTLINKNSREMTIKCNKCGTIFKRIRFNNLCPICDKELTHKRRSESQKNKRLSASCFDKYTHEKFVEELYKRRQDLEVLSEYKGSHKSMTFKHKDCGYVFSMPAYYAITGIECPKCRIKNTPKYVSNIENDVYEYVKSIYNGVIKRNTTYPIYKELDIFMPDKNVAIEVNGTYWHSSLFKSPEYHVDKSKRCENLGIRLIHIWEYEWFNERQRPILENIIKNALGLCENKIYARKCKIKVVNKTSELREFFDKNNIQGFRPGKFAVCLEYENRIVMSYIIGSAFFGKGKYQYEVIRGATELNYNIVGRS